MTVDTPFTWSYQTGGAQGLLGTGGQAVIANAQGQVSIGQGNNQLTQAKLAQLMTMNLKNTTLRAAAAAQTAGGGAGAGAAGTNQAQLSLLQVSSRHIPI